MKRSLGLFFAIGFLARSSEAKDFYIAQNAVGTSNGTSCSDAYAYTFFNDASSWGSASNQIGPGTTVHVCGTLVGSAGAGAFLGFRGGGASGSPITLLFEKGATLEAPYWGQSGAINTRGNSYVVIDGGTNGIVRATANGTGLAYQEDTEGIVAEGGSDVTIQGLTLENLYVHTNDLSDESGEGTVGIDIWNGSNLGVLNCTIHDVKWAVRFSYDIGHTYSTMNFRNNSIYNIDHGLFITDSDAGGRAIMSNFTVSNNSIHDFVNWDDNDDDNHHDAFHLSANSTTTQFTNYFMFDNEVYGDPGIRGNSGFFSYPNAKTNEAAVYVFNNVFVNGSSDHCWANGFVGFLGIGASMVVNNTMVSDTTCKEIGFVYEDGVIDGTFENNVVINTSNAAIYAPNVGSTKAIDFNDYYESSTWNYDGVWYSTMAKWQSATGFDKDSITANPLLSSSYQPTAGSPIIGAGTNLSLLCTKVPELCLDKAGTKRPSTSAWDLGAYEYCAGSGCLSPDGGATTDSGDRKSLIDADTKGADGGENVDGGGLFANDDASTRGDQTPSGGSGPAETAESESRAGGCSSTGYATRPTWPKLLSLSLGMWVASRRRRRSAGRQNHGPCNSRSIHRPHA
jgi:hypothetical protein